MDENTVYQLVSDSLENQSLILKKSSLCNKIFNKHQEKYGNEGALKIQKDIDRIFTDLVKSGNSAEPESPQKRNTLLVGKIQSGKTSSLEYLTALAFENGYNLLIIVASRDKLLLSQTVERFRKTFDIPSKPSPLESTEVPVLFTSDANDSMSLKALNQNLFNKFLEHRTPVILCVLKNAVRLKAVNKFLSQLNLNDLKAFIIDDEGDQASLNIARDKKKDASAIYEAIREMKKLLNNPLYCSVTASPHANIFLNDWSDLRPSSIHLLYPGDEYCGAEKYHLQDNSFIVSPLEEEASSFQDLAEAPNSLKQAVQYFLLASTVMKLRGIDDSDMIVHVHVTVDVHQKVYQWIFSYIANIQRMIEADYEMRNITTINAFFEPIYKKFFTQKIQDEFPINSPLFFETLNSVVKETFCVLQNSKDDNATRETAKWYKHRIFIGANLLQRGLTFEHLVTTYFTRWAKSGGEMDTNLQRARWFGYRSKYFDLCRMFTTNEIAAEYVNLAYMEDDLWRQFIAIEDGELCINDIVVLVANESKQKPTSRAKADFAKLMLSSWIRQDYGVFDIAQLESNNAIVKQFIDLLTFEPLALARKDGKDDCLYTRAKPVVVKTMFEALAGLYNDDFDLCELEKMLSEAKVIAVVQIGLGKERRRAFYEGNDCCKIKVLQQGRSSSDKDESAYPGDAAVVDPSADLTIQIHNVVPMHLNKNGRKEELEFKQYMFAIYSPKRVSSGYIRS